MVVINVCMYMFKMCLAWCFSRFLFENDTIHINYTVLSTLFIHTGAVFQEPQVPIFEAH